MSSVCEDHLAGLLLGSYNDNPAKVSVEFGESCVSCPKKAVFIVEPAQVEQPPEG